MVKRKYSVINEIVKIFTDELIGTVFIAFVHSKLRQPAGSFSAQQQLNSCFTFDENASYLP